MNEGMCPKCGHGVEHHTVYGTHFIDDMICMACLGAFMSGDREIQTINKCPLVWGDL